MEISPLLTSPQNLDWNKHQGLIPCIIQSAVDLRVLMLGYMNQEALEKTLQTQQVTFFSRSKQRLWIKGETSGHTLQLISIGTDCDRDTILCKVIPAGPTCHKGTTSCFDNISDASVPLSFLSQLQQIIAQRANDLSSSKSYVKSLLTQGTDRIAQKVGEEGLEVALASVKGDKKEILEESADLVFHLLVNLYHHSLSLEQVITILEQRHNKSSLPSTQES